MSSSYVILMYFEAFENFIWAKSDKVPEIYRIVDKKVHQFTQASRGWYS